MEGYILTISEGSSYYKESMELLYNESYKKYNYSLEKILGEEENKGIHIIYILEGFVVGHVRIYFKNDLANISQVVVRKNNRKLKIGTTLIKEAISQCEKLNMTNIILFSRLDTVRFYKNIGFMCKGEICKSIKTGLPLVMMKKI